MFVVPLLTTTCTRWLPIAPPPHIHTHARACTETGIPTQSIFFGLAAWAAFMSLTAADKLAVKKGGKASKSKTTSGKTVGSTGSASA